MAENQIKQIKLNWKSATDAYVILHPETNSEIVKYESGQYVFSDTATVKLALDKLEGQLQNSTVNKLFVTDGSNGIKVFSPSTIPTKAYLKVNSDGTVEVGNTDDVGKIISAVNWTDGTTDGPIGTLVVDNGDDISIPAIPSATDAKSGVVTTAAQNFAGVKTFKDNVIAEKDLSVGQNVVISGNLTVNGTTTTVSTETLTVKDNLIVVNSEASTLAKPSGISVITGAKSGETYPAYGFVYDPITSMYKIGEGTVDGDKKDFTGTSLQNVATIDNPSSDTEIYYDATTLQLKARSTTVNTGDYISGVTHSASSTTYSAGYFKSIDTTTTDNTLSATTNEAITDSTANQVLKLHKISKTGSYNDLLDKPTLYWADVQVDTASSLTTEPTFKSVKLTKTDNSSIVSTLSFNGATARAWSLPDDDGTIALQSALNGTYSAIQVTNGIATAGQQILRISSTTPTDLAIGGLWCEILTA